jgi:hypothetical protein
MSAVRAHLRQVLADAGLIPLSATGVPMKTMSSDLIPHIRAKFPRRQIAFGVHDRETDGFSVLTVVVKDEPGHAPLPWQLAWGTHDEMARNADVLNDAMGLTLMQAHLYVASSMFGAGDRRRS